MTPEVIETTNSHMWVDDTGVLVAVTKGTGVSTGETMVEAMAAVDQLRAGRKVRVFWDARRSVTSPRSWMTLGQNLADRFVALAALIDEHQEGPWPRYQDLFSALLVPFRLFGTEEEARAWLEQFDSTEPPPTP